MTVFDLIKALGSKGIRIWLEDDQLKFKAPKGALSSELRAELVERKPEVIEFLKSTRRVDQDAIPTVARLDTMPLSLAQKRLWFMDTMNPGTAEFNVPSAVILKGELNVTALERALNAITERHETLRTTFSEYNGEGVQIIHAPTKFDLQRLDFTSKDEAEALIEATAFIEEFIHCAFDLREGPLLRCVLISLPSQKNALAISMHHIISDGWSMGVFQAEMGRLYNAFSRNAHNPLPPLQVQYADYCAWQHQPEQTIAIEKQKQFWLDNLSNAPRFLDLPTDFQRPEILGKEGSNLTVSLTKEETEQLKQLAKTNGVTLYVVLLSAYKLLLAKYSRQRDICVSVPVFGRNRVEVEGMIGFFVNSLVIRSKFEDNPSLNQVLLREKEAMLSAFNNQDVPINEIVAALKLEQQLNFTPLRQAAFSFLNSNEEVDSTQFDGLELEPMAVELKTSKTDLSLFLYEKSGKIEGLLEFNTELFTHSSMETLAGKFHDLLQLMIAEPECSVNTIDLASPAEIFASMGLTDKSHEAAYPLSLMQRDLYLNSVIQPEKINNSLALGVLIHSEVDVDVWQQALQLVSDTNSILRVEIKNCPLPYSEEVYQCIKRDKPINFDFKDLAGTELGNKLKSDRSFRDRYSRDTFIQPYSFPSDNLFYAKLFRLDENTYFHVLSSHHAFWDGASHSLYVKSAFQAYEHLKHGTPLVFETTDNYEEYVPKARALTDTQAVYEFWRDKVGQVEPFEVVRDEAVGTHQIDRLEVSVDEWNLIEAYCKQERVSTANYIRLLLALLVRSHYQITSDFFLAEVIAGRSKSYEKTMGCFIQSIPVVYPHTDLSPSSTIAEILQYGRQYKKTLNGNEFFSLSERKRLLGKNMLEFQSNMLPESTSSGYEFQGNIETLELFARVEGVVRLQTRVGSNGTLFELGYFDNQFTPRNFLSRLLLLNEQIIGGAERIGDLDLLLPEENRRLFTEWNPPVLPDIQHSVLELIEKNVSQNPSAIAVVDRNQQLEYQQLWDQSGLLAKSLVRRSHVENPLIGICLDKTVEMIVGVIAVLRAGAAYVPLDPHYPSERLKQIVQSSGVDLILSHSDQSLESIGGAITRLDINTFLRENDSAQFSNITLKTLDPSSMAYVMFTSGSTGLPKGVVNQHKALYATYLAWESDYRLKAVKSPVYLQLASFSFDVCTGDWVRALCSGGTLVLAEKEDLLEPARLVSLIERHKVTFVEFVPAVLRSVAEYLESNNKDFSQLRHLVVGSDSWFDHDHRRVQALCGKDTRFVNSYGVTEATIDTTFYDGNQHTNDGLSNSEFQLTNAANEIAKPQAAAKVVGVPVGKPFSCTQVLILNQNQELIPPGCIGELCIVGEDVALGYWQDEEKTRQAFMVNSFQAKLGGERLYKTGDLASFSANGIIELHGRMGNQVKIRGNRIELEEIESVIGNLKGVQEVSVIVHGELNDKLLVAYLRANEEDAGDSATMRKVLQTLLPDYMIPSYLVYLDELPLTPNGKIDKNNLPELDESLVFGAIVEPRNDIENKVHAIWSDVLGRQSIGVDQSFFEVGGHSLMATQVVSRLRSDMSVELPLKQFFRAPSIEGLAGLIVAARETGLASDAPPIVPLAGSDEAPLSYAQHRLWFTDQLDPGNTTYNMPSSYELNGVLNVEFLRQSFELLVERHEVLRTNFIEQEGIAQLNVLPMQSWTLPITDLTELSEKKKSETVYELVTRNATMAFNLSKDVLFRTTLLKLDSERHVLNMCLHHIAADGWSIGLLLREVTQAYVALCSGQSAKLPVLPIQYSDFSHWQRQWMQGDVLSKQLNYWTSQLQGAPRVLRLPTDRPRPEQQTFDGAHCEVEFSADLTANVLEFCQQHSITPFVLLLSAYQLVLARYSGQDDLCVGIPVANRNRAEIESLIGCFINILIMRTQLQAGATVESLLAQVQRNSLDAFDHQDMPAELLVDALQMERASDSTPGAQVGFAWQNLPDNSAINTMSGLAIKPVTGEYKSARTELTLMLAESNGVIHGLAEYNVGLFDESTIVQMMQHYRYVIEQMISDPQQLLRCVNLVSADQLRQILGFGSDQVEVLALSPPQRDVYLDYCQSEEHTQNCISGIFTIKSAFDIETWKSVLLDMTKQLSVLRMQVIESDIAFLDGAYTVIDDGPVLDADIDAVLELIDLTHKSVSYADIQAYANKIAYAKKSLLGTPFIHQYIFKVSEREHYCFAAAHHFAVDGFGLASFSLQMAEAYRAKVEGHDLAASIDFNVEIIKQQIEDYDTDAVRNFWQDKLSNVEPLSFSLSPLAPRPSPANQAAASNTIDSCSSTVSASGKNLLRFHKLPQNKWLEFQQYCRTNKTFPPIVLKSLYGLLIHAYTRPESDFYIADFIHGRQNHQLAAVACAFHQVPSVFSVADLKKTSKLTTLFHSLRQSRRESRPFEHVSAFLLSQLAPQGSTAFTYNFYNFEITMDFMGQDAEAHEFAPDLYGPSQLVVRNFNDECEFQFTFAPDLFDDLDLLLRLEGLIDQLLLGHECVGDLSFLTDKESEQQLTQGRGSDEALDHDTVIDWIELQCKATPSNIAVVCNEHSLSYQELERQSNQLANYLISQNIGKGDIVAVCLSRSVALPVVILSVLKAGAAYIPLDAGYPEQRMAYILDDSSAPLLIADDAVIDSLPSFSGHVLNVDSQGGEIDQCSDERPSIVLAPDDLIYLIYTSGSTGNPKASAVRHNGEVNLLQWYVSELGINASDTTILVSALGFDLTQKNMFAVLTQGGTLVIPDMVEFDAGVIRDTIQNNNVTLMNCAPSAIYALLDDENAQLNSLRYVVLGGEPIHYGSLKPWLDQNKCTVLNSYGPTECTDVVAFHEIDQAQPNSVIPIGKAISNTQLYILNDNDQLLPVGIAGELCIAGIGVGAGYYQQAELTDSLFVDNPWGNGRLYRSGDIARYLPDGSIEVIGRKDFQVKIRGLRIELGEVEFALEQLPGVKDSLVSAVNEKLVAYVVVNESFDREGWRSTLRLSLMDYMIPSQIIIVESWPLTPNGKVDRKALELLMDQSSKLFIAPRTDDEKRIAQIWCDILGVDKVSVVDDFFEIGGHSLLATRAVARFKTEFAMEVSLRSLFEMRTIEQLAKYVTTVNWALESAKQGDQSDSDIDENDASTGREEGLL